ncbi:MAG: GGDEF domain-containing protein [Deltaproteobacteria bacterium]|nr:MAG: GGDEF domain-containing protein [Deltaproteobacteria bacterium]
MAHDDDMTLAGDLPAELAAAHSCAPYAVVIRGPLLGTKWRLPEGREWVVGRSSAADLHLPDETVSRRHCVLRSVPGALEVEDLGSRNGLFYNGRRVRTCRLRDGDCLHIGLQTVVKFVRMSALENSFHDRLLHSATRDPLTGAYNRAHFAEHLRAEARFATRHGTALSLLLFDIDHFKAINDRFGHPAGDHVLQQFALCIAQRIRCEDLFARYGGEEFAVIARGIDARGARLFAERLRAAVESMRVTYEGRPIPVTVSVGVASAPPLDLAHENDWLDCADRALYAAKRAGRNCVRACGDAEADATPGRVTALVASGG